MPWPSGPVVVSMPGVLAVFGVAGGGGVELAEPLDLLDPHAVVAGEVEQRVEQHRAMAGGQHEPVAVRPARVGGIELVEAGPQRGGDIGHAHRHAGMAGLRRLHRVDGERADGVGHLPGRRGWPGQDLRLVGEHGVVDDGHVGSGHVVSFGLPAAYRSMHLRRQPWPRRSRLRHRTCYSNRVTTFASTSFMTTPGTRSRARLAFRARRSIARG